MYFSSLLLLLSFVFVNGDDRLRGDNQSLGESNNYTYIINTKWIGDHIKDIRFLRDPSKSIILYEDGTAVTWYNEKFQSIEKVECTGTNLCTLYYNEADFFHIARKDMSVGRENWVIRRPAYAYEFIVTDSRIVYRFPNGTIYEYCYNTSQDNCNTSPITSVTDFAALNDGYIALHEDHTISIHGNTGVDNWITCNMPYYKSFTRFQMKGDQYFAPSHTRNTNGYGIKIEIIPNDIITVPYVCFPYEACDGLSGNRSVPFEDVRSVYVGSKYNDLYRPYRATGITVDGTIISGFENTPKLKNIHELVDGYYVIGDDMKLKNLGYDPYKIPSSVRANMKIKQCQEGDIGSIIYDDNTYMYLSYQNTQPLYDVDKMIKGSDHLPYIRYLNGTVVQVLGKKEILPSSASSVSGMITTLFALFFLIYK